MIKRLLLFDIDGTLLAETTGHREAFAVAFEKVYGVYGSIDLIKCQGKTDQMIIREVMLLCGVAESAIATNMSACMKTMCAYFSAIKSGVKAEVFSGVPETLAALDNSTNLLGLVTGNLEPIAYGKLANAAIGQHFRLGGFGSDAAERAVLVKKAIKEAADNYGFADAANVYLFGDTPRDIAAALSGSAKPIGVATGIYTRKELSDAGAYAVIDSLADHDEVCRLIGANR